MSHIKVHKEDEGQQELHEDWRADERVKVTDKPSLMSQAPWYKRVFFTWAFHLLQISQTKQLTLEDLGGIEPEYRVEAKLEEVERVFKAQKEKNIFKAVMWAFRWSYAFGAIGVSIEHISLMLYPQIIAEIVKFMQDKEEESFNRGIGLFMLLMAINVVNMPMRCHTWFNNYLNGTY